MKYDASMTQFHGDIVAAVRLMCGKDIDARSNSEGASPAPLRDYLKERYGYNGRSANGVRYLNTPSKGMEIKLDREVGNDGDTSITLSWSQVAKFIRDNPSEIFKEEDKSEQDKSERSGFPCDGCGYDEKGCCNYPETPDDYCVCGDKQIPKNEEMPSHGTDEEISAPAQTETAVVFDYSELDGETAEQLGKISENVLNIKKKYIFDMAEQVKKAHDLLANHYGGKFGAWCESVGISRFTGNNLVNVVETFNNISEEQQKNLSQLKPSLLYEAARPSAPAELVEAVKNGDITTHKDYIALKKELEEANKKLEDAKFHSKQQTESFDRVSKQSGVNYQKYLDEMHKNQDLMKQIQELESRPVEVAVEQDTAAIAERDERIADLEEQLRSRDCELDFGNNASCDKMSEFYEMLHGKALNALKDCMAFIRSDGLPQTVINRAVGRFGTLKDLIEMYIDELEEI